MTVSPIRGIRSDPTTKSRLMLPTTTMGLCIKSRLPIVHHGRNRDHSQTKQEKNEHGGNQSAGFRWSAGEFLPDENAPHCRNHRGSLTDGIGHRRTDHLRVRCHEVEHRSRTPYESANEPPEMPSRLRLEVLRHID